jgi:hypothetical protein
MLESLNVNGGGLELIFDSSTTFASTPNLKMTFGKYIAFRSMQESYMSELWGQFAKYGSPGRTFLVEDSPWIFELAEQDSLFAATCKDARHYVMATDMDVIEVISRTSPIVEI